MTRVTCFVTTIGAHTFAECVAALQKQSIPVRVDVIANLPWWQAQNEMVSRCETELLVQVDEDMIMMPDGVARLVNLIDAQEPRNVMSCAPVLDVYLDDMPIMGTKIYRHELLRTVPFVKHVLGDMEDRRRWTDAGLTFTNQERTVENCVALHGTSYSPEEVFERWRRQWQRHRRSGRSGWVERWIPKLEKRLRRHWSKVNLYAWLGATVGATETPWADESGPDFTAPNPVLNEYRKLFPTTASDRWTAPPKPWQ